MSEDTTASNDFLKALQDNFTPSVEKANKRVTNVRKFMKCGGATLSDTPSFPTGAQSALYTNLIFEELTEIAVELGNDALDAMREKCQKFLDDFELVKNEGNGNLQALAKELIDLEYVLYNAVNGAGLHEVWDDLHQAIHNNNMSKFCTTEEQAMRTATLSTIRGEPAEYFKIDDMYVVRRKSDNKILKSMDYKYIEKDTIKKILYPTK
jgi:predicted HAD superfamily Cof-like phosphohydrolase